jgi:hypothetical protein
MGGVALQVLLQWATPMAVSPLGSRGQALHHITAVAPSGPQRALHQVQLLRRCWPATAT